jgi:small-conductance mechanosensitive channel
MSLFYAAEFGKIRLRKIKSVSFAVILFFSALFLFTDRAAAQNTASPANASSDANSAQTNVSAAGSPTPIPVSEIIAQSENAASTLKEIAASTTAEPSTEMIERDLPVLTEEINARLEETAKTVEGATSLDNLRSFEADWRALTRRLPDWNNDLTLRARKLEDDLRRLDDLRTRWEQTREVLSTTETPPEILARVDEIIRSAAETRRLIIAEQARAVTMQNRVAEQQKRVDEALKTIAARREALVGQLLVRDSPPIWSGNLWTLGAAGIRDGMRGTLDEQIEGLSAFVERNREKLIFHILVFALLAGVLFYLRRRARPIVEANPELKQSAVIFYLPVPTALVLAILFNTWIYPQTPQILGAIFGAVALIPTVIILRKIVERPLYPLLYWLVVFYFVDQIRAISDGVPALVRPIFLAEMLGAFLFFLWLYRSRLSVTDETADGAEKKHGQVFRTIRVASLVVLPFFAVAFFANVLGYVNLARLIGDAVLRSAYTAGILYGIVRILDGLIVFALRFRPLNLLKMVRDYAPEIQEKLQKFIRFVAFVLWLLITLELFTLREIVVREGTRLLTAELNLGSLSISAADVLLFFFVVWAAFLISRFVRFALEEDVFPRFSLAQGIPYAISTIINYLILLAGFFFAVGAAGVDLTRITVLVGAFGVGIGFGLQNIFNNFISGLILLFERPVKIGDEIKIGDAGGTVKRIGIRASRIRLWDNSEIIVPNSKLISENVKNWSSYARRRGIEIPISAAHDADTERVIELLKEAAKEHPMVAEKPAPQVILSEIVAPTLNFKLRVWTAEADKTTQIASELAVSISRSLAENGITVPPVPLVPATPVVQ